MAAVPTPSIPQPAVKRRTPVESLSEAPFAGAVGVPAAVGEQVLQAVRGGVAGVLRELPATTEVELVMSLRGSGGSDGQAGLGEAAVYEVAAVLAGRQDRGPRAVSTMNRDHSQSKIYFRHRA